MSLLRAIFDSGLKPGAPAPTFCLEDQNGKAHKLSDYLGKWLVIFFYPKDESFFCTKQACSFRDESELFKSRGIEVVGISVDSVKHHEAFAASSQLNFPLLSDFTKRISEDYGVLLPFGISNRVTFVINPEGKIASRVQWANWFNYGKQVLAEVEKLQASYVPPPPAPEPIVKAKRSKAKADKPATSGDV